MAKLPVWAFVATAVALIVCLVAGAGLVLFALGRQSPTTGQTTTGPVSTSSDWYEVYFTEPKIPDKPEYHKGGIDTKLVAFIDRAQRTLDLADYDFDLENVAQAMARAKQRGVTVRMVTDTDTLTNKDKEIQKALAIVKQANIPIVDDQRGPIMHNKFVVADLQAVWTGSWNFTDGDTYRLNNNAIWIKSPELAQNYHTEFEKMFGQKKFGPNKPKGVPNPKLTIGGASVENYFAPEDEVEPRIIDRITGAKQSIRFLAFSFTADSIGKAVRERARAGIKTTGVFETTGSNTEFSEYTQMKKANIPGLEVYTDGSPYAMHHKVFIIDERTVIFGSFNFSDNAANANDENLLIVDDANLARAFKAEFDKILALARNPPSKKEPTTGSRETPER